jgi:hypothetical protein
VRKVSGVNKPSAADERAFERAVTEVTTVTTRLLGALTARAPLRTREGEQAKARARWAQREARMARGRA